MISLELCEISFVFREIKTTTAKIIPTCKIFIIFEVVFIFFVFAFVFPCLISARCAAPTPLF